MHKTGLLLWLLLGSAPGWAQSAPYSFSADIEARTRGDAPGKYQFAAWDYSRIGEYPKALAAWDRDFGGRQRLAAADSLAFRACHAVSARAYILARAKTARLIILNEAHHNPRHRVFAASLLPGLARLGFSYFGAEGFTAADSLLNQRGYPVLGTGFYVSEPCFGNLVRTAARTGYRLFAYEADSRANTREREIGQARHIAKLMRAHPQAKFFIYCGFSHADERKQSAFEGPALATRLKELTGEDPFTIDQTQLTETATAQSGNPLYRVARATTSAVFLNANGQPFNHASNELLVDVNVYHPPTAYRRGRPTWLFGPDSCPVPVAQRIAIAFPCLVLAYDWQEDTARAVAMDVIELKSSRDAKVLVLGRGRFTVVARNKQGQRQAWQFRQ